MRLVRPSREYLASYVAALEQGWSPDNVRGVEAAREELQRIAADADAFLASMDDREAKGPPIALPDGSYVPRLPGWRRWMWDDEFAGSIGFRWQPGTSALPPHCLGHIGYAVVPWKQGRGYATRALGACSARGAGRGPRLRGDHDRPRQPGVATSHRSQRRQADRTVHQASAVQAARPASATVST